MRVSVCEGTHLEGVHLGGGDGGGIDDGLGSAGPRWLGWLHDAGPLWRQTHEAALVGVKPRVHAVLKVGGPRDDGAPPFLLLLAKHGC